jgi:hypothetical protein
MTQVHIVFRSGGLLSPIERIQGVYEDTLDANEAAAKEPLLYAKTFDVIPASRASAPETAAPAAPAVPETTPTS